MYGFTSARKMSSVLLRNEGRFRLYNKVRDNEHLKRRC
jgi:hypothetical protein